MILYQLIKKIMSRWINTESNLQLSQSVSSIWCKIGLLADGFSKMAGNPEEPLHSCISMTTGRLRLPSIPSASPTSRVHMSLIKTSQYSESLTQERNAANKLHPLISACSTCGQFNPQLDTKGARSPKRLFIKIETISTSLIGFIHVKHSSC